MTEKFDENFFEYLTSRSDEEIEQVKIMQDLIVKLLKKLDKVCPSDETFIVSQYNDLVKIGTLCHDFAQECEMAKFFKNQLKEQNHDNRN